MIKHPHSEETVIPTNVLATPPDPHVLVVDDDSQLRQLVGKFLRSNGFRVTSVGTAPEMKHSLASTPIDLVILDLMLPGTSGLELCRNLRATSSVPVIMLTAKSEEADQIVGLEVGADDYVTKPFSPRELLARIKAVLRRTGLEPNVSPRAAFRWGYGFNGWRLDTLKRELTNPEGIVVDLSTGEFNMLLAFVEQPQKVLTREQLLDAARNRVATGFDRSIDVQISRLRRKITTGEDDHAMIKTVRGVGYMFVPTVTWS